MDVRQDLFVIFALDTLLFERCERTVPSILCNPEMHFGSVDLNQVMEAV